MISNLGYSTCKGKRLVMAQSKRPNSKSSILWANIQWGEPVKLNIRKKPPTSNDRLKHDTKKLPTISTI